MIITDLAIRLENSAAQITATLDVDVHDKRVPTELRVVLDQHDRITVMHGVADFPLVREARSTSWTGRLPWSPHEAPSILVVSGAYYCPEPSDTPMQSPARIDVPCRPGLALARDDGGAGWSSGDQAAVLVRAVAEERQRRASLRLRATDANADSPEWAVLVLVDQILLTTEVDLPGIQLKPLMPGAGGQPEIELINAILPEMGFNSVLALHGARSTPKAIAFLPAVQASSFEAAADHAVRQTSVIFDLVGLNRHSAPRLAAAAVGTRQADGSIQLVNGTSLLPGYSGNLAGGFLSGEDAHNLDSQWNAVTSDPRIALWLRLHNEGSSDRRWDYRVFRAFNLLEGIAREVIPKKTPVLDASGLPRLLDDGNPYTAKHARGVVSLLLGRCAAPWQGLAPASPLPGDAIPDQFWDHLGLWVEVRNRVAHAGSWVHPHGATPRASWLAYDSELRQPDVFDGFLRATRDTVMHVLRCGLDGRF